MKQQIKISFVKLTENKLIENKAIKIFAHNDKIDSFPLFITFTLSIANSFNLKSVLAAAVPHKYLIFEFRFRHLWASSRDITLVY